MDLSSLTPDKQMKLQYWLDVIRGNIPAFFRMIIMRHMMLQKC